MLHDALQAQIDALTERRKVLYEWKRRGIDVTQELAETAPAVLWATCALGLALFLLYDLTLARLTRLYRRRRRA